MEEEDDGLDSDNSDNEVSNIDHRGDMRPRPIITPPMRHLIPIVREVLADIRTRFWDVNRQDEEGGPDAQGPSTGGGPPAPLQGDMEAEVHDFIYGIPTVHPIIAVLKHVITVMENQDVLEETDDASIRWSTRTLHVVDVSPDHPLLPTANQIIELCDGRLYDDDDEEDDDDSDFYEEEEEEVDEEEEEEEEEVADAELEENEADAVAPANDSINTGDNNNNFQIDDPVDNPEPQQQQQQQEEEY